MHTQVHLNILLDIILVLNQLLFIFQVSIITHFRNLQKKGIKKKQKLINPHNDDISHGCSQKTNHGRSLGHDWLYLKHPSYHGWGVILKPTYLVFGINHGVL